MIDQVKIKNIIESNDSFAFLSDYLAPQEKNRFAAMLEQALESSVNSLSDIKTVDEWIKIVKPNIQKEFEDGVLYFGVKDLLQKFDLDLFLSACYQSS